MHYEIVEAARALVGVKFHHQGRSRDTGVDCLGLLVLVARACHFHFEGAPIDRLDMTDYGHNPDVANLRAALDTYLQPVGRTAMRVGDVGLFAIDRRPQHLGIIADYPAAGEFAMIHAYAPQRRVVEHRIDELWDKRLVQLYRFIDN